MKGFLDDRCASTAVFACALLPVLLAGCGDAPAPELAAPRSIGASPPEGPRASEPDEVARARMQARFAVLDQRRSTSRTRYNDIAFRAGRVELGPERARRIAGLLDRAGYSLQPTKGPAAFADMAELEREIRVVDAVDALLAEAETELQAAESAAP